MNDSQADALRIEDLRFAYGDGHQALKGVSFTIPQGEKVALLGPNGAGKSTLLLHLNGLLQGDGSVDIVGQRVDHDDKKLLRRIRADVGLIFQDSDDQLFSNTVGEDVAFGPKHIGYPRDEVKRRVSAALADVGLSGFEKRAPYHLSGGEKRRAAIATILSMDPKIIAADEPSSGLDPRARRGLIELLVKLPQTLLIATHDLELARAALPRSIIMNDGKVVADGPTKEIVSDQALLEAHGL